jgi:serine/threonine-protein kinase
MSAALQERLVAAIAEREPIDWDAERDGAMEPATRALIEQLRVLDAIARLHQSIADPLDASAAPAGKADVRGLSWGDYELYEEIGKGSYGVVYRAHDRSLKRDLAIKLLHPSIAARSDIADRIYREGQALARIHHPNVVAVYAVGPHGGRLGLCMELVRGRTLREQVKANGLRNAEEAAVVGKAVCRALSAVHRAGLVHRDVSARNVMQDDNGRIVLMDFGAGLDVADAVDGGRAVGTPLYMAPELFDGQPATPQSDVYSAGVLLYYLVTGRFPVEGRSVDDVAAAKRSGAARLVSEHRPDLPEAFVRAVAKAIAQRPGERYASAAQMEHALGLVASGDEPAPVPARVPWVAVLSGSAAALGAIVGLALLGRMSTYAFHMALAVAPPFTSLRWIDALAWGAKSVVAPLAMAAALAVSYVLLDGLVQWVKGSPIGDLLARKAGWLRRAGQPLGAGQTIGAARLIVLASVVFFLWVRYLRFPALIDGFTTMGGATEAQLLTMSSANAAEQDAYRMTLSIGVFVVIGTWIGVFRRARARREPVPTVMKLAALGTVLVPLLLLNLPYRIFLHAEVERATYQQMACSVLGERPEDLLLLCPERGRRPFAVAADDPDVRRLGELSNVFDALAAAPR